MKTHIKIKKNDTVMVMTGADKGKKGKVLKVFPAVNKLLVEGVRVGNVIKRAQVRGAKPQIISVAKPIHASNVMVVDSKGKPSRVGYKVVAGNKTRITKSTGQEIK